MSKLSALEKQLAKVRADINEEKKRLKKIEVANRKRMIEIIGAYYYDQAVKNGDIGKLGIQLHQDGYLKKTADRELFLNSADENQPEKAQDPKSVKNSDAGTNNE